MRAPILCLTALLAAVPAAAQAPAEITVGDRVRVTARVRSEPLIGQLAEPPSTRGITLRNEEGRTVNLPWSALVTLEVSEGRADPLVAGLKVGAVGVLFGSALGWVLGEGMTPSKSSGAVDASSSLEDALTVGAVFGALGFVVGVATPGEEWREVETPARVAIGPTRNGGWGLVLTLRR